MQSAILVLLVAISSATLATKPSYIKSCSIKKADFNECALKHANLALPFIVKGDRDNDIPPMTPLVLPLVEIAKSDFTLTLKNLEVYGLENATVTQIMMNETSMDVLFHLERIMFIASYKVDGKLIFLKLTGEGPFNVTGVGGNYRFNTSLETYERDGVEYVRYNKPNMIYTIKRAYFKMDNLLGIKEGETGIDVNKILNDNWDEVLKDIAEPLENAVTTVVEAIMARVFMPLPKKYIFAE
jgi:hypothetical protein